MLNYGVYANSGATTSSRKSTKRVGTETIDIKATIGPMGDAETSEVGKEGDRNYKPPGYQFLDMLDGSSKLAYASTAALVALVANTLY